MLLVGLLALVIPISLTFWLFSILTYTHSASKDVAQPLSPLRWLFSIVGPILIVRWGLKRRSLDSSGALAALVVGFAMTMSNFAFFTSLMTFFVLGSKATKFRGHVKKKREEDFKEGGQRNWVQVLCNGGVATELAILYMMDNGCRETLIDFTNHYTGSWLSMGVLGALACCCGDTFASELGTAFHTTNVRLITSWEKVPAGTNGGVSFVGLLASCLGGLVVGVAFYAGLVFPADVHALELAPPQWIIIILGLFAGLAGSLIDSILGATVQYSGYDETRGCIVETPGPNVQHISGVTILDNHGVNLVSGLITSVLTARVAFFVWGYV